MDSQRWIATGLALGSVVLGVMAANILELFGVLVVLAGICLVTGAVLGMRSHRTAPNVPQVKPAPAWDEAADVLMGEQPPRDQMVVTATPETLQAFFRGHTGLEAHRLLKPYLGKLMRVSGRVKDVAGDPAKWLLVSLDRHGRTSLDSTHLIFEERNWIERASLLRLDDEISVVGRISEVLPHSITLEECEFIDEVHRNERPDAPGSFR